MNQSKRIRSIVGRRILCGMWRLLLLGLCASALALPRSEDHWEEQPEHQIWLANQTGAAGAAESIQIYVGPGTCTQYCDTYKMPPGEFDVHAYPFGARGSPIGKYVEVTCSSDAPDKAPCCMGSSTPNKDRVKFKANRTSKRGITLAVGASDAPDWGPWKPPIQAAPASAESVHGVTVTCSTTYNGKKVSGSYTFP